MAVTDVAEPFEMSLAAISKHLTVLTNAGLIQQERRGRVKWCKLDPDAMQAAWAWMQGFGHFDALDLDGLEAYIEKTLQRFVTPTASIRIPRARHNTKQAAGDPGRIRTCNLPLRRGLLYPVEPLSQVSLVPKYLGNASARIVYVLAYSGRMHTRLGHSAFAWVTFWKLNMD